MKVGIIAGAGQLPVVLAQRLKDAGEPFYVARIAGLCDPVLSTMPGGEFGLGEMGARFRALKQAECTAVTFAGVVKRPDFSDIKLDARGALMLPKVVAAARKGDDALLRVLVEECEREGFKVLGADEILGALLAPEGPIGTHQPNEIHRADIEKAAAVAAAVGAWDIGQGCVVCDGLVLAVEAQEGTDAMLQRVAELPEILRGVEEARRGVLVKRPKPQQERRVDLPTIGVATIERAAAAGLAGIAVEAGAALIMDRATVVQRADALGLFVFGFAP